MKLNRYDNAMERRGFKRITTGEHGRWQPEFMGDWYIYDNGTSATLVGRHDSWTRNESNKWMAVVYADGTYVKETNAPDPVTAADKMELKLFDGIMDAQLMDYPGDGFTVRDVAETWGVPCFEDIYGYYLHQTVVDKWLATEGEQWTNAW